MGITYASREIRWFVDHTADNSAILLASPTDKSAQSLSRSDADRVLLSYRSRFHERRRSPRELYSGPPGPINRYELYGPYQAVSLL
jgi:hypothetical protein